MIIRYGYILRKRTYNHSQRNALATALPFILVVFLISPPYIDAAYAEGIQIEHGPRDRSDILKQYASNISSGGANEVYPLKGTYHNILDVQVLRSRYHYGWYDNVLDVLVDDTAYFNPQAAVWLTRPDVEWTFTATNNRTVI